MVRITLDNNEFYTLDKSFLEIQNELWYHEGEHQTMYYFQHLDKLVMLNIRHIFKVEEL